MFDHNRPTEERDVYLVNALALSEEELRIGLQFRSKGSLPDPLKDENLFYHLHRLIRTTNKKGRQVHAICYMKLATHPRQIADAMSHVEKFSPAWSFGIVCAAALYTSTEPDHIT